MSFRNKVLAIIAMSCLICAVISVWVSASKLHDLGEEALVSKSRAILSRLEAVRSFIATQGGLKTVIEKMVNTYPDGKLPDQAKEEVLKQVPIFASMQVGALEAEKEGYEFRIFSELPRNSKNKATESEMEIFNVFRNDPKLPEIVKTTEDKVYVYRPVRLSEAQGCLNCHGNPSTSPWKNGKDILGIPMENWADGRLHGVFTIISKKDEIKAAAKSANFSIGGWMLLIATAAIVIGTLSLKGPLGKITEIAGNLKESGESLSRASVEIASSAQSLSAASSEAAAALQETTASTEEMSSMIKLNSNGASEAKTLASECESKARSGQSEVKKLAEAMLRISESSNKIREIITVIDDISFQTNLLALNAAVEAARAGEQGKGFAVVAEAVRALAQRSASSAKEIGDLIQNTTRKIQEGSEIAGYSDKALEEIVDSVSKLAQLSAEISNASTEQSQGVQNINQAINELDKVTQQNAAASQETAASSQMLKQQSTQLYSLVEELMQVLDSKNDKGAA